MIESTGVSSSARRERLNAQVKREYSELHHRWEIVKIHDPELGARYVRADSRTRC